MVMMVIDDGRDDGCGDGSTTMVALQEELFMWYRSLSFTYSDVA
jgi:hypothetical protein